MKRDEFGFGRVVLTIYCGRCAGERRPKPGRLAYVAAGWAGLLWWCTHSRDRPREIAEYQALSDVSPEQLPAALPVICPVHGAGNVVTAEVLEATNNALAAHSTSLVLAFQA